MRLGLTTGVVLSAVTAAALSMPASAGITVYSNSFETDGGGWVPSGLTGDWERGIPIGFAGSNSSTEPVGGHTGDFVWGTVIGGDHSPNADEHLQQTFDFTGLSGVTFSFWEWSDSGGNSFDMAMVLVNGNQEYLSDGNSLDAWREVVLDLSAYDGLASVTIDFNFITTGVVERTGWYIDDVSITAVPSPAGLALLGLAGVAARRRRRA